MWAIGIVGYQAAAVEGRAAADATRNCCSSSHDQHAAVPIFFAFNR